jgi:hypothetical protein
MLIAKPSQSLSEILRLRAAAAQNDKHQRHSEPEAKSLEFGGIEAR